MLMIASFNSRNIIRHASRAVMDLAARMAWQVPGRFAVARSIGPAYSLRCVVFHDVSTAESPFTKGMGVSISPGEFEAALKFLVRYYTPVSMQDILANPRGLKLRKPAILVTFDDGYASIAPSADLCCKLGVPAALFLNAAFLDNKRLAPDNLVCYVANVFGMDQLNQAARAVKGSNMLLLRSMADVFHSFFPLVSLEERRVFLDSLADLAGIDESVLAPEASLYLTSRQVRELASAGFEIASHTYSHVHCRSLTAPDFPSEIDRNKEELEAIAAKKVRLFSVPYGSSADLNNKLIHHLKRSGYQAAFLSESVANPPNVDPLHLDRVSIRTGSDHTLFLQIEILPRIRVTRNRLSCLCTPAPKRSHAKSRFALTQVERPNESFERTRN